MTTSERDRSLVEQDAEARALARATFDVPLLLEAGAGTGKTTTLIARLVTWSLGPGWELAARDLTTNESSTIARAVLDGIVAITFTEAAAADMGTKLESAYHALASRGVPLGCAEADLPPDVDVRTARAAALVRALDRPVVHTIHAFCRGLLADHPFEARIAPNFQVDADGSILDSITREVIDRELAARLMVEPEASFARLLSRRVGPRKIQEALWELASDGVRAGDLEFDPYTPARAARLIDTLNQRANEFLSESGAKLARVGGGSKRTLAVLDDLRATLELLPPAHSVSLESLDAAAARARERWSKESRERLGDWSRGDLSAAESKCLGDDARPFAAAVKPLHVAIESFCDMEPLLHDSARRTLAELLARVRTELLQRGVETYADLLRDAKDLLATNPTVVGSLRRRVRQLVVDEFQDTDPLQCDLIRRIALDDIPGTAKPGLFLVGDPKQSIYGWRNADLAAYEAFADEIVRKHRGRLRRLSVNHRSTQRILAAVERAMTPTMLAEPRLQPAFEPLVASRELPGQPVERVVPWRLDPTHDKSYGDTTADDARTIEADWIARDLARQHALGTPWQHMAMLLRSLTSLDSYLAALRAHGVPYDVAGDKSYYQRREIVEASVLVRAIADPRDHVALVGLLRSSLVGVPDAALIPLWRHRFHEHLTEITGSECAAQGAALTAIDAALAELPPDVPGLERIAGFGASLAYAVRAIARLRSSLFTDPADTFVETMRTLFLVEGRAARLYQGRYRVSNLERFYRRLAEALDERGADAHSCLRALRLARKEARDAEEARPKDSMQDAVQILTIHKSKGLDFDHVYVAGVHTGTQSDRVPLCEVAPIDEGVEGVEGEGGVAYAFFHSPSPGYERVQARRERVAAAERVRTLYVAMTRARDRLVLTGCLMNDAPWTECTTHAELLAHSEPSGIASQLETSHRAGTSSLVVDDTHWILPDAPRPALAAAPPVDEPQADVDLAMSAGELARACTDAHARMQRPWSSSPSTGAEQGPFAERGSTSGLARVEATAIGRAFHRLLETLAAPADPAQLRAQLLGALERECDGAPSSHAVAQATALLDRFVVGTLHEKLTRLDVIARELPVIAPPSADDAATGFVSGTIDLVYRDRDTGEIVIADYKTDAGPTDAARYAAQGRAYQRALRNALELPRDPRFELWYVAQDRIEVVA